MEEDVLGGHLEALSSSRETQAGSREEEQELGYFGLTTGSGENKRDKGISQRFCFNFPISSSSG